MTTIRTIVYGGVFVCFGWSSTKGWHSWKPSWSPSFSHSSVPVPLFWKAAHMAPGRSPETEPPADARSFPFPPPNHLLPYRSLLPVRGAPSRFCAKRSRGQRVSTMIKCKQGDTLFISAPTHCVIRSEGKQSAAADRSLSINLMRREHILGLPTIRVLWSCHTDMNSQLHPGPKVYSMAWLCEQPYRVFPGGITIHTTQHSQLRAGRITDIIT